MSEMLVDGRVESGRRSRVGEWIDSVYLSVNVSERIAVLAPGESTDVRVSVLSPVERSVSIVARGFPRHVASLNISPSQAKTPASFTARISAYAEAEPGVYGWSLSIIDLDSGKTAAAEEPMALVILPKNLSRQLYGRLLRVYAKTRSVRIPLWHALMELYPEGATFSDVKTLYQLITLNPSLSDGTVVNTLKSMIASKIIEKVNELYLPIEMDEEVLYSRVDLSRTRFRWQVLRKRDDKGRREIDRLRDEFVFDIDEQPKPVKDAYRHAMEISVEHGELAALYFLLYTLMWARKTEHLLLWNHGWFVILQQKAKRCWHFYSWLIHHMLDNLGLEEGIYYNPWSREHEEARRIAQRCIVEYYGSHKNARRLATYLVENDKLWTEEREIYVVKLYYYENQEVGVEIYDHKGQELYHRIDVREDEEPSRVETYTAYPFRHANRRNAETYFHRPGNLF